MKASVLNYFDTDITLRKMLLASIIFHMGLFALFGMKLLFFPEESLNYQASVRVDLVALPDKQIENITPEPKAHEEVKVEPKKPEPVPVAEKKVKPPTQKDAINLEKKRNKAIEKLKALQAIEKLRQEKKNKSEKSTTLIKGNILAAGTSLKGLNKYDFNTYIGDIDAHIKANWELPEWLAKSNLTAEALVKIDKTGNVIERRFTRSSGNATYDSLVLEAIDKSSPFPPPQEKFINIVGIDGIIFRFP